MNPLISSRFLFSNKYLSTGFFFSISTCEQETIKSHQTTLFCICLLLKRPPGEERVLSFLPHCFSSKPGVELMVARHKFFAVKNIQCPFQLRGAWKDRDTNDIFAHCSLIFYFLDLKFSNFVCLSELQPLIWFFFKNSFRKKKNIQKTTQNALAPSIFIVLAIVLKLGTPLLHTQAQNTLLQNF